MREQNKLLVNKLLVAFLFLLVSKVSLAQCTTDLALGKAVTSSSVNANNYAYYATDGNTTTRWESAWSDPQWIMVDLGGRYPICTVNITWENARGQDFLVQVSDDASNWRTKATVTGNTALNNSYSFTDTARYVRMYGTARVLTGYGYSIYTLEVLGTAPTTICSNLNVAQSRPGFASSVVGANAVANAFDNSATTRWESASSDPQYIYVDLGAQYDLCRVALTWEAAYGKDFTIDISSNGSTWTTAATIVGNYIKNNSIAISGQARYVRMRGTARGTTYGYSLYDFAVYAMLPALSVKKLTDAAEPGTGGSFRFSLPTGITYTENITVNYTVTGTAASGTDYTSLPASVIIPAGTNYVDVSYNTNDDKIIEGNETVIVNLTSAEAGSSTTYVTFPLSATDYSATSTISDDDNTATNMVLNLAVTTGAWEPATNGVFTLSLPTGYTAKEDVTVNYTVSGTATAGTDYSTLSGTVVLPALSNSVTIPVTITDDKIIEGTETLALTWNQGTSPTLGTFSGSGIATMGVIDDDNIAANKVFTIVADGDAAEPSTNGAFKISLPAGVSVVEDVTVNYTVAGTATPGADYNTLAGTVNFPAGSNSISLPVTVIDDNDIEATETVIATLTGGSAATFGTFTGTANATVNIADNDVVPANKEVVIAGTTNGTEPSANGVFTVSLPGGISYPEAITVNYTVSGTAIAGTDYTALSGTVTIPAGVNSAVINVPVIDDDLIEVDETVIVTLTSAAAPSFGSFIANTSATINIADNEPRLLGISAFNNLSEPSTDGTVTIAIMGAGNISSTEPITVTYTVTELGATVDEDYEPLSGTVTIPAGDPYVTVPIRVKDDKIIEGTENLRFTISGGTSPNLGTFTPNGAYASQDLSINDDEQKIVTITKATDASEPSTNGAFMVSLPAGTIATEDITVNYTVSGTATEGDDYNAMTGTVTIFAGDNSANIPVEVIDDQQIENPETVIATLTGASAATLGAFTANTNATLTIADDEDKTITIANAANGAEPSANGAFTVSLPTGITATEDITLTYSVSGTATPGADYTTLGGTVTIAAGDNSAIIDVPVLSDNIIEADETVTVTLTAASGATLGIFTANTSATITIADGTNKTLSIANTADGAEPATKGSFRVALPAGITATEDLTLTYTVSGSATPGDDYTALSGTVSIPAGDNTATIDVPVIDDQVIEANETVTVTLTGASATNLGTFTANADATVTITDNDAGSVTIANAADAAEPGANGAFIVNLPAGLTASEDVTVYYTVTGTATPGNDYTSLGGVATIPAGNNSATIPITVIDDKIIEVGETVVVTLTSATTNNLGSFTANNNATVTIADDDDKTLTIAPAADAAEPSTNGAFTVSLPTGVTAIEDIALTYSVSGSATGGTDYTALSGTAIIYTGNNSATISVPVIDDQVIEGNETVTVTLTGASAATLGSFTANGNATVNIVDDEDKTISITNATDAAEPATPGLFKVSLPGGVTATEAITVNYTVTGGTATAGTDYTTLSGTVLLPAGDNNANIPIVVVDDKIIEGDETVILTLNGASAPTLGAFTANIAATVNIADDENRTISIANTTDASEPGTNGEFTASLPAGVTALEDITVSYTVSGGTATAGDDYAALSGTVLIPAGNNSATIPVVVNDDKLLEGDETLVVSLTAASAPTLGAYTANTDATLTIADDESKTVTIVKSADAAEPATNGAFTIGLPAGVTANEDISVTYTVTGTATAGDDYNTLGGTATIFAGTNSVAIPVFVNDDQLLEGDETVVATLTGASSTSLGAFTANNAATVIIADDESKTIGISSSNAAEPGTNGAFTLRLAPGITAAEDITVTYTVSGTATAGTDYTNLGGTATILAGSNSAIIDVAVIDDQIIEGAETVTVTLTGASGATVGTLTANAYADLTIVDDEVKVVSIVNTADAAEPATNGGFIVSLPGGVRATEAINVTYTVTGTATAGIDYTSLTGSVVIPAGANSATIDVAVIDDQVIEGDETVMVTLTGASATTLGSFTANGNATVTIADDEDKNISITKAADAAEAATNGAFTVSLPSGVTAAENITVTYAITGTAAVGSDYNTLAGSVVIPAGANSANIDVQVIDDQVIEGDETVMVTLTGASATTLGSITANNNATVTIADDENKTISITKAADAAEPSTNGAFTVSLPSGVTATEPITVNYTVTGTATAGTDYAPLTGSVSIPAGVNIATIDVVVTDDQIIEGDETVIVTLTGASAISLGTFTANANATLTIADDENKTISITKAVDATEPTTNGEFTVSLPSGVTATEAITITYTVTGTATAGSDYTTLTGSVIIPAGANSANFDVQVIDDRVIEGDETVIVTLTGASATTLGSFTANNNATLTIADDENKTISITKAADAAEPSTNGAFTVSLPSGVTATEAITITYTLTGMATAGTDYTTLTGSVIIPAGANSATIDVAVADDQVIEGDETVIVTLTGASATTLGSFTANGNSTVIIVDDENKTISITKAADAAEPTTNGAFTVSLPSGVTATEAITVNYIVTGTATASTDYNTLTDSVVIPAGANIANIDVQVIDDQVIEGDETVIVTLTGASATTLGSFTANNNATLTIADDENKTISITKAADAAEPSTNGALIVSLPAGVTATEAITVNYTVTGTATAGTDYTTLTGSVSIPAGANSATIDVTVTDDQVIEGDETVIVTLTGASATTLGSFTANNNATMTIADDENRTITIANNTDASEPSTNGLFTVSLPTGVTAAENITVTYAITGTATAGSDYTTLTGSVIIPTSSNSANIDIQVTDDQVIEGDETVIVTLTGASATTLGSFTANNNATMTIADDENKTITITKAVDAAEPATNGAFTVSLPSGVSATEAITVTYTVTGTATAGTDYTALSGSLVIPAGANSANIDVQVIDDQVIEGDETVIVTLTGASATTLGTFTANGNATLTIADDENKTITITKATDAAEPATNGAFTVSLPSGVSATEAITITYTVTGTATAGTDYTALSGSVVIPAGANSANIDVQVIDDQIIEGDETVIVTLTGASASTLGTFTANSNATATIADDEDKTITITKATDAAEPATNGAFTVSLPTGVTATEAITVTYTVTGTATAGTDYTAFSGSVVIPAGANSTTIDVAVIDDQLIEADEAVIVTLTGAAANTLGAFTANNNATVTIADNEDRTITIAKTTDAAEPSVNGAFTVSLASGVTATEDINITYTISGTATANDDYTALSGSVTILAGTSSTNIPVLAKDDQIIETDETIIATLTAATATNLGTFTATQSATVTIADNDAATITIAKTADAAEPNTNGRFTVSYPTAVTAVEDVLVGYTVTGAATAGADYTTLPGTVTIPAGQNSATIDINVIDDNIYEGNEDLTLTLSNAFGTQLGTITVAGNATLTISDDDSPVLTIVKTTDAAEPTTNGGFTVSMPTGVTSTQAITFNYTVSGTATAGSDYTVLSGTATIPAGVNSITIPVSVVDDKLLEGDETVIVTITDATASSATLIFSDDENKTITIASTTNAAEPSTNGVFTVSLAAEVTATEDITVTYTVSGTATASTDYNTLSGTVTIPAGANSANIDVTVIDDQTIEADETVIATLTTATAPTLGTFTANTSATVTIADDENKTISIVNTANASEPATNGAFTVSLPTGVTATEDISVTYTISGTATASTDYNTLSGKVTIPAGENSANIDVTVIDDQTIEADETVIATLTTATAPTLGTFTANTSATVTIVDDENKTISIVNTADASEPATNGVFTVSLPTGVTATEDISVTYTISGTATAGTDYNTLSGTVTIPAGANSTSINLTVIDDQTIEADETVIATLTAATAPTLGTFNANSSATVTIADDENKTISIVNTANASEPATNGSFTVSLPTGVTATEDISVTYTVSGTATASNDYTTLSGTATIPAGANSANIDVTVIDDQTIEADETVIATLTAATASTLGTFTANTSATVTIADDENKTISIVNTANASEPMTNGSFTVSLPTGVTAAEDISVTYTISGTATAGTDYNTLSGTVTIPAGANSTSINVTVIDDQTIEADETVIATLTAATAPTLGTFTANTSATVIIADDENKTISIVNTSNASEPATNGSFTVSLPTGVTAAEDITVTYTASGTATAGTDYTSLSGTATIPAGTNSANIDVTVIDDKIIEGNETIAVTLTGATATTLGTFTANTSATVTIADDDLQIINITTTNDASEPATNGTFTVSLPTGVTSTQNITVTYTVSGTATAGTDYTTLSGTATIPAGANSTNIDVPVTDDKIIEGNETVILTINDATASSATMAITDDDLATITITKSADAAEPATNGTFTISLPAGLTSITDILVPYTVSGIATTGVDYTTLSGMATIPAGSNSATINVTVIDDKMIETNETVILTLADGSSATLTITDDEDATISITKTSDAAEPSTNGAFTVSLPTGITSATAITVPYTISGTATAGADYTTLTGNVIIPAGQNSAAINVSVLDDKIIEGNETVILTLTDVTKTATLTITDDENQTISITKTANAAEPATNGSFTVSLPTGVTSTQNISVPYTVSGTATAGTDYTALTGSVIIPAGSNNASITVNVIDDQLIEGSETVILTLTDVTKTATLTITDNDLPTFSIVKTADAAEPTTNGSFTLSYPPNITAYEDVTITYTLSGTATAGTDYTALTGSVTIPAGKNSAVIAVNVIDDLVYEGNENVTITLNGASGATLGSLSASGTASLTIADNDLPPLSIVKTADAAEPSTKGGFVISTASAYTVTSPITVTYTIAGTATNGTDYSTLSGTITIPAGANSITLPVNVIDNYKADGTRTVILTLVSGTDGTNAYQPGTDYTATVNITDNDVANYQAWKVASVPSTNPDGKIQPGQVITYTIYVRNTSNTAIGPLTITDKIPTNTNWESGGSLASGVVSFSIPSLAADAVTQVSFQVKTYENLDGVPSINNTAHVSDGFNKIPTYACDPQTATCDTVTKVIVRPAKGDLTITKTVAAPGPYVIEDYITYNIVVKNVGYSSFTNLVIVDSLPYNLDLPYHTTTTKGSTAFSVSPRKVTWYVNELVPGDSVFITVTCRILAGDHVINTAYVWANEGEADYTNNTDINKEETSNKDLYFINAFRPGAAQNNKFVIVGIEKYPGSHLLVYSRWGNVVYESKNYNNDWTADNIPMGEYIYKVVVPKKTGKFTYSGTVLIIK